MYYSDRMLTFLVAAICTRYKTPCLVPNFGAQASRLDSSGLHLFSLFRDVSSHGDIYQEFLADFLTTESRSRHCFLNNQRYAIAAHQCLEYLHKNSSESTSTTNRIYSGPTLTAWALRCLPTFLEQSSETEELIQSARSIDFDSKVGEYSAAESAAKAAIAGYLSRCTRAC